MLKQDNTSPTKEEFDLSIKRLQAARRKLKLFLEKEKAKSKQEVYRKMDAYSDYDNNEPQGNGSG